MSEWAEGPGEKANSLLRDPTNLYVTYFWVLPYVQGGKVVEGVKGAYAVTEGVN